MSRINGLFDLHPQFRDRLMALLDDLKGTGLFVFESVRTPQRQRELYAIGRDPAQPNYGKHVTNAGPYQSAHQYGMAADLVFQREGAWYWPDRDDKRWDPLLELAPKHGLETLSFERPHVQVQSFDWREQKPGPMDVAGWTEWLRQRNKESAI